jgi:hypothetical protein
MTESTPPLASPLTRTPLELLAYQTQIVAFLKGHDPDVWTWFASTRKRASQAEDLRFDLLKSTYRIDRDSQPELYLVAERVAERLGITAPITIYQAQNPLGLNASLAYLPDEVHVVLHGPVASQLSPVEMCGLLGHEMTHFLLWQDYHGDLLTAFEVLLAFANDSRAHPAHLASLRLLNLYNEIVCDRGALLVTQDVWAVISMLVKVQTGVQEVNPDSYLRQADEIFARGPARTEGLAHPEAFIRARAIQLWAENDPQANVAIDAMIQSPQDLNGLDLLQQQVVAGWTRRLIDLLLSHKWFQSDPILAHARLYFEDYAPPAGALTDSLLAGEVKDSAPNLRDYFCFVLFDFLSADRELDEPSLAAGLQVAEQLDFKQRFMELARQELRLRKSQLEKVDARREAILLEANLSAVTVP